MRILVTGAGGFIGHHVCSELAAGHHVRRFVRRPSGLEGEVVAGDLLDRGAVRRVVAGCDAVVHLAGRAHVLRERSADAASAYRLANVEATELLCTEAAAAGVRVVVFLSSVAAVCTQSDAIVTEDTPPAPDTLYGRSKLEAEGIVRRVAMEAGMRAPILRPTLVYGPGMKGNPERLLRLIRRRAPLPIGAVRNRRSFTYVGNLVHAIRTALEHPQADGVYLVADREVLSTAEFVSALAAAVGSAPRLLHVPPMLLQFLGRMGDLLRPVLPVPLDSEAVRRLTGSLVVQLERLTAHTGWTPVFTTPEGVAHTGRAYREPFRAA